MCDGIPPVRVGDVAMVQLGPAQRRGMLDKTGAEAVGGSGGSPVRIQSHAGHRKSEGQN